jgi:hypothetical protein
MDNDNKIAPASGNDPNKVQLFLQKSLKAIRHDEHVVYDLDTEFAKTRRNKDYFVIVVISIAVVLVGFGAWAITSAINKSSRSVAVDITVFEDLNLKNVLDLAKKAQDGYDQLAQQRDSLAANHQEDLANLRLQKKSELDILAAQKRISDGDRAAKKQAIEQLYAGKEKTLNGTYAKKLSAIEVQLADAKKNLESFDKKRVEEASAQKKVLDSQQDLFELEKKKMKDSYESEIADLRKRMETIQSENSKLKTTQIKKLMDEYQAHIDSLDPAFNDAAANDYVSAAGQYDDVGVPFRQAPTNLPDGFKFGTKDFAEITRGYDGLNYLLGKVAAIPFANEAGSYVASARKIAFLTGNANERIIKNLLARMGDDASVLADKEKKLAETSDLLASTQAERDTAVQTLTGFQKALTDSAAKNAYDGYVLDVTDPATPGLFVMPDAFTPVLGTDKPFVYVYRAPKTLIATLRLTATEVDSETEPGTKVITGYTVSVEKLEWTREILPMDYLSVKKR